MGIFDFNTKRRQREKEYAKRSAVLIREVSDWVCEDPENRVLTVCMTAIIGGTGIVNRGIGGAEKYWRYIMIEHQGLDEEK